MGLPVPKPYPIVVSRSGASGPLLLLFLPCIINMLYIYIYDQPTLYTFIIHLIIYGITVCRPPGLGVLRVRRRWRPALRSDAPYINM